MAVAQPSGTRTFFAKRLRELRIPRGFRTARKLANELGIDENRYTRYERAEVEPDLDLLVRISDALQVTPNDLLGVLAPGSLSLGFEDSANSGIGTTDSAVSDVDVLHSQEKRSGAIWALSREIALAFEADKVRSCLDIDMVVPPATGSLEQLQLIASVYRRFEIDLFGSISKISLSPLLISLASEQQERFARLMERATGSDADIDGS